MILNKILKLLILFFFLIFLSACASKSSVELWEELNLMANKDGFRAEIFKTDSFILSGLAKGEYKASSELVVYIEGDGRGVVRGRVSLDPTPHVPMGYLLARLDKAVSVLYLARIGQFQPSQTGVAFRDYWSNKRFAKEVLASASQALDQAKIRTGATSLHLIGYSGGAGLALLLAQQRNDILSVTTIAGLLDIDWWVKEKNFRPLIGSLNPASKAKALTSLPQVHFFGTQDIIIPPKMSSHFQSLAPFNDFKRIEVVTNHWELWIELWPELFEKHIVDLRKRAVLK